MATTAGTLRAVGSSDGSSCRALVCRSKRPMLKSLWLLGFFQFRLPLEIKNQNDIKFGNWSEIMEKPDLRYIFRWNASLEQVPSGAQEKNLKVSAVCFSFKQPK